MSPHTLTNFEIQKHYHNEPKINRAYSRNNLTEIMNGTYIINLHEYKSIGTHWIALYVNGYSVTYFDSFGVEYIPKKLESVDTSTIMCGHVCIGLTSFILKGKSLLVYTNLFFPNKHEKAMIKN